MLPTSKRILIVEDDKGLAELFAELLQSDGANVARVESAAECSTWLAEQNADLLLIDYSLPDCIAPTLIETLRIAGCLRPFIVITGHGDERVAVEMMKLGASDYLVKDSLVLERLPAVVNRAIEEIDKGQRLAAAEAALRAEKNRADQYFESAAVMMLVLDREGRVRRINRAGCEILGLPAERIFGASWFDQFVPAHHRAKAQETFQRLIAGQLELARYIEDVVRDNAGQQRLLAWHNSVVRDDHGAIIGTLSSAEDITERRKAEAAQREHEVFRQRVFESSHVPLVVCEADTYRYIDCNPAAVAIYRYPSRSEVLGKTPADFSAPVQYDGVPSVEKARSYIEHALTRGRIVFEWLHQRPDGERWDGEVHLMSFTSGERRFLQFTLLDITERKRAAAALQESEEKFAKSFHDSALALTIRDQETGRYLDANPRCVALMGFTKEEIVGHTSSELGWMEDFDRAENLRLIREQGNVVDREIRLRRKDGTAVLCSFSAHVIPVGGRACVLASTVDITERKNAETRLREQFAELQRWHAVMLDRESRVLTLKREVNLLARRLGEPVPYPTATAEAEGRQ